jgi:hypothetical protein
MAVIEFLAMSVFGWKLFVSTCVRKVPGCLNNCKFKKVLLCVDE